MTIAIRASDGGPVTVGDVNLKFIWDVVSRIKVGDKGKAYVVDANGYLVADPDIGLVLRKTDLSGLPHVKAALDGAASVEPAIESVDLAGKPVLTAVAPITTLGWEVFVEQPVAEVYAKLNASILRTALLLLAGLVISALGALVLARGMARPIRTLQEGAQRIGAGQLDHSIDVRTGDELEALAGQFNHMTAQLRESYAGLERKVDERTAALKTSLEQQTAISEILRVISGVAHEPAAGARGRRRTRGAAVRGALRARDADRGRRPALAGRLRERSGPPARGHGGAAQAHVDHRPRRHRPSDGPYRRRAGRGRHRVPRRARQHHQARHARDARRTADARRRVPTAASSSTAPSRACSRRTRSRWSRPSRARRRSRSTTCACSTRRRRRSTSQTAISEILRVISSFADRRASGARRRWPSARARLCDADDVARSSLRRRRRRCCCTMGDRSVTLSAPRATPIPIDRGSVAGRAFIDRAPVHVADLLGRRRGARVPGGRQDRARDRRSARSWPCR